MSEYEKRLTERTAKRAFEHFAKSECVLKPELIPKWKDLPPEVRQAWIQTIEKAWKS